MTEWIKRISFTNQDISVAGLKEARPQLNACGGYCLFEGIIRDHNAGQSVSHLEYECYEALAFRELERILDQAHERYGIHFAEVVHRTGHLTIGDVAVFIQTLAPHRREAFGSCEFIIDELKASVPIWKKEFFRDGNSQWTLCHHHSSTNE